jgi:predicted nucleic acid-binding protein
VILVDTCAWSAALRRRTPGRSALAERLTALVADEAALVIPGIVLQEVLSGLREDSQFPALLARLAPFPVLLAEKFDHLRAAEIATTCRRAGITVTAPGCLIAAQAIEREAALLTDDRDFVAMSRLVDLRLVA